MKSECVVRVKFFASIREILGVAEEQIVLNDAIQTVGELRAFLMSRGGVWSLALALDKPLRMAYDQVVCDATTPIVRSSADTDQAIVEVAFFPPVTGG